MDWAGYFEKQFSNRPWKIMFIEEALEDLQSLDASVVEQVAAGIVKVNQNPLPKRLGGYGNELGKDRETGDLRPLLYIKYLDIGIRVIYGLEESGQQKIMKIIAVDLRAEKQAYRAAARRLAKA
ncbi:MAG: type II toxin-antitoxin system RelE/ParE family toxin [Firmicutes bacterium]|nr:type II toxin-antitoxin system RelE/ParE family toxin [Bacillota bacterium]